LLRGTLVLLVAAAAIQQTSRFGKQKLVAPAGSYVQNGGVRAHVVHESSVRVYRSGADTAEVRITLDSSVGSARLEQRVIRFDPGRSKPQQLDGLQGILYVVSGRATLETDGESHDLEPEAGAYLRAGDHFVIDNPGPDELVTVLVTTWPPNGVLAAPDPRVVRYSERPSLPAGKDREFRYLVHRDTGSPDVTQFIGTIPPGRAPHHSHVYDEVIYVLDGRGQLHVEGRTFPIGPGSCLHLPPLLEHALENEGDKPMRVLGVFHPSGDPASRAYEANE
jgi:mannose-6-phosphate isomerase-like protein (cupin superfamily)